MGRVFEMDRCTLLYFKWVTNKDHYTAQGTLLNIMWQPGWEGNLRENGYVYVYGCIPSLLK